MLTGPDIQATVHREINALLSEAGHPTRELTGAEPLNTLGLSSLLLARLVIQLEEELGADPFEDGEYVISDVRTVEALTGVYAAVLAGSSPAGAPAAA